MTGKTTKLRLRVALAICFLAGSSLALKMHVSPDSQLNATSKDIKLACIPEASDGPISQIVMLQFLKDGQDSIALTQHNTSPKYNPDKYPRTKVEGNLKGGIIQSHLNISIHFPRKEDAGIYTCKMYYLITDWQYKVKEVIQNITWREMGLSDLDSTVRDLLESVSLFDVRVNATMNSADPILVGQVDALETRLNNHSDTLSHLFDKDSKIHDTVLKMEKYTSEHKELIDRFSKSGFKKHDILTEKMKELDARLSLIATTNADKKELQEANKKLQQLEAHIKNMSSEYIPPAFMATMTTHQTIVLGQDIVFGKVSLTFGDGYNSSTGVFVVPADGTYLYHITLRVRCKACTTVVGLVSSGNGIFGKVFAGDQSVRHQSTVTGAAQLKAGEHVWPKCLKAKGSNNGILLDENSNFYMYRLAPL